MRKALFTFVLLVTLASVQACPDVDATTTQAFFNELSDIDSELSSCPVQLPTGLGLLLGDGETVFNVQMSDGSLMTGTMTIDDNQVQGIRQGSGVCKYQLTTSQSVVDSILQSSNKGLAAAFWLGNRGMRINGCSYWTRFKSFITQPIGRFAARRAAPTSPASALTGKPDNCDETYMQGHQGYAANSALWDSYSADTDGVCQSQFGTGTPQGCVHSVQLSTSGNPYYLCWYNN